MNTEDSQAAVRVGHRQEQNRSLARRLNDSVKNERNLKVLDELLSQSFVNHTAIPGYSSDREGVIRFFTDYLCAFPDLRSELTHSVAEGDLVIEYFVVSGTHQADFMGIPATQKTVRFSGSHILHFENDQIVGHWNILDQLSLMLQLEAVTFV